MRSYQLSPEMSRGVENGSQALGSTFRANEKEGKYRPEILVENVHLPK
jgi:hypothetical protein